MRERWALVGTIAVAAAAGWLGTVLAEVALGEPAPPPAPPPPPAEHPEAVIRGERVAPSQAPIIERWEDEYFPFLGFEAEPAGVSADAVRACEPGGQRAAPIGDMVTIPAGPFRFGDDGVPGAGPARTLNLPAYAIDRYEVTNVQYREFVRATGRRAPYVHDNWAAIYNWYSETFPPGLDELPVVLVTWVDADAFCRWANKRLPTEPEWEKAARGAMDGRRYPWGGRWDSRKTNVASRLSGPLQTVAEWDAFEAAWTGSKEPEIFAVGSYPADRSPYGVMDMAGNVSEWVGGTFEPYPGSPPGDRKGFGRGLRVARGNSWGNRDYSTSLSNRYPYEETRVDSVIGFRCASDSGVHRQ